MLNVLCAAHLTYKVQSPYERRGGILLISPSGHGKSTLLGKLYENLEKVMFLSDLTTRQLGDLRAKIVSGNVQTLILDELEKIYQRREDTAVNLEGHICALVEQGFSDLPNLQPSARGLPAKALVIGNCTEEFFVEQQKRWSNTFMRRFLVCMFRLENPDIFGDAMERWDVVRIGGGMFLNVCPEPIRYSLKPDETKLIRRWILRGDQDDKTPFQLFQKIACVLRWRFKTLKHKDETMELLEEFSSCLSKKGTAVSYE